MNILSVDENKNNQIKKANDMMQAKGVLSSTAQKMLLMLISMIRVDDSEFQEYALNINDYFSQVESSSKNVEFAKEKALELMRNPFELKRGVWYNWCSKVDITKVEGYIVFSIHNDLKPYLLNLQDNFTIYNIVNILALRGDYTPRLYEYFLMRFNKYKSEYQKQYNKTPKSFTFELKIDWLRDTYRIPPSYRYNDVKRQIIDKAKKQFEDKTNIKFEYQEQKIGRKVDRLIVTVRNNDKGSNDPMHSRHAFIDHVRSNYKPSDNHYPTIVSTKDGDLKIDKDGRLYLSSNQQNLGIIDYDSIQSDKLWQWLYDGVLSGEFELL